MNYALCQAFCTKCRIMHAMSLTVVLLMTLYSSLLRAYRPDGYVGCFKDKKDRILKGKHRESKTNSGDECKRYCMSYRYRYAGTKKEDECYCGHTIPVQELLYICNHKCPGNHEEICGGRSTISVYDTWCERYAFLFIVLTEQMDDSDNCATSPCKNGATCEDIDARSYNCICFGEWTGKNCDKETETTTLETSSLSDKTQLSTRIKITTHFPNIKTTDKSESNIAEYVLVPVALVVLIAITVAVVCIKRRRAAKNVRNGVSSELATTNKQPKHREVGNASCNDYKVKSTPYSYCSTSRTSTYFNSGYVDIEPDGCDNKQNKYNHLTIQTLPYFDNTYSHLKANQNNISWISDITYSHLDNENSPTETTEDIDTYNRLQVNTSNGMKRFQDESDCDTDYSHLDARAQKTEIDADDYSHINYKSPEKNKEHSSSDLSGNTHELAIVETSDGEIRHDYFVLEKIS